MNESASLSGALLGLRLPSANDVPTLVNAPVPQYIQAAASGGPSTMRRRHGPMMDCRSRAREGKDSAPLVPPNFEHALRSLLWLTGGSTGCPR